MAGRSTIEWTEATWNPVTGCAKVSAGCKHCYAERLARRLKAMGNRNYERGFEVTLHESALEIPLTWKKPKTIFVNSMSDLFHDAVPTEFILRIFSTMVRTPWHRYQVLTKRSRRLKALDAILPWAANIWMGVTVERSETRERITDLETTGAAVKFLSLEPLLGPLPNLPLSNIDWVIVGGESGPRARPMEESWVRDIQVQCASANVPFFFKQWGGVNKKRAGRVLEGRTWDELPVAAAR